MNGTKTRGRICQRLALFCVAKKGMRGLIISFGQFENFMNSCVCSRVFRSICVHLPGGVPCQKSLLLRLARTRQRLNYDGASAHFHRRCKIKRSCRTSYGKDTGRWPLCASHSFSSRAAVLGPLSAVGLPVALATGVATASGAVGMTVGAGVTAVVTAVLGDSVLDVDDAQAIVTGTFLLRYSWHYMSSFSVWSCSKR